MNAMTTTVQDLRSLRPGEIVEARRYNNLHFRGRVESISYAHGVVWMRDDATGCRTMLHTGLYDVFRMSASVLRAA